MTKTIIALDFSDKETALAFLDNFQEPVSVKVGMELVYSAGLDLVKEIKDRGHFVFLDLKLHDIPNTVKKAMANLAGLGVDLVNVHAAGGKEMMKAAKEAAGPGCKCIAVTQLTSTSKEAMNEEQGIPGDVLDSVLRYAQLAKEAGLDGVVCSVHEAKRIHEVCGPDFLTVTPGIRLAEDNVNDQKRVATPGYAKEQGSDFIVVGRSITQSEDPKAVFDAIEETMHGCV